jgi:plasmid stability protein
MKNVTITLPEQTLAKLRIEAAKAGKSVSRFMADLAEERIGVRTSDPGKAMRQFLSGPLYDLTDENGKAPSREQIYDRSRVR